MTTKAEYQREIVELEAAYEPIRAEFPDLVARRFECRVGWFPLIRQFFAEASEALEADPTREFVLLQVKEKFGGLRIYYRLLPFETVNGGAIPGQRGGVKAGHGGRMVRHRKGPDRALSCVGGFC